MTTPPDRNKIPTTPFDLTPAYVRTVDASVGRTNAGQPQSPGDDDAAPMDERDDGQLAFAARNLIRRVRQFKELEPAIAGRGWKAQSPIGVDSRIHPQRQVPEPAGETGHAAGDTSVEHAGKDAGQQHLPARIGRFEIRGELGRGGCGVVLLAFDPQLNRQVALKVPQPDVLASADGMERFLREARAAALLAHPNIVSVFEAGHAGPVLYIALEWIDGPSLATWLKDRDQPLAPREAAGLVAALAHGVQHAHARGIVHRDLKPSNILLRKVEQLSPTAPTALISSSSPASNLPARVCISDFGLARIAAEGGNRTRTGSMVGTPLYMAPEQTRTSSDSSTPASDIYGLGAILYELLAGKPPFTGDSLAAIVHAVNVDPPVPLHKLNRFVPRDLEAICLKCLEKEPGRRYESSAALAEDLERFTEGLPVRARHPGPLERAWRWIQRNQLVTAAATLAVLSLTTGLLIARDQAQRAKASLADSQQQRQRAERHRDRAEAAIDTLLNDVAASLEPVPQMQSMRRRLLRTALEHELAARADEGDDPESRLRVAESLGRIAELQYQLGEFEVARASLDESIQLLGQIEPAGPDQERLWANLNGKARLFKSKMLLEQQQPAAADEEIEELLQGLGPAHDDPALSRLRGMAFSMRGRSLRDRGETGQAEMAFLDAIAAFESIPLENRIPADECDITGMFSFIGGLRYAAGKYDEAVEIWQQVVDRDIFVDPELPQQNILRGNRAANLANLGMACAFQKDFPVALTHYAGSIDQYRELCDQFPLHFGHAQGLLTALAGRSVAHQNSRDSQAAIESFREAVAWGEQLVQRFGPQPKLLMETGRASGNLGNLLQFRGDKTGAIAAWSRGLELARQNLAAQPDNGTILSDLAFSTGNLASFHLQENSLDLAAPLIEEALGQGRRALGLLPGNQKVIDVYRQQEANQALLLSFRQEHDEALEAVARIAALQPDRPDTQVYAAKTAARCQLAVAGNLHELFGGPDDEAVATRYADRAIELLTAARDLGFDDFDSLRTQPEFSGIAALPAFEQLAGD